MQTVLRRISYILGILLALIAGVILVSAVPIEGNYTFKMVNAGSMEPAIPQGSIIMVKPKALYNHGDIITFTGGRTAQGENAYVTHRIVNSRIIEGNYEYITKGDANIFPDTEPVRTERILGKVILHVPYVEGLARFIRTPGGFFLLIIIPAIGIAYEEWRRRLAAKSIKDIKSI